VNLTKERKKERKEDLANEGNIGNKGGSGKEGNKGGSGSPGNKGGAPAGNTNASSAETKARKLFHEGEVLQRHGNSTAALDKYDAALKISPELCDAHNNIGVILCSRFEAGDRPAGQFSTICELYEKASVGCSESLPNLCVFRFIGENGSKSEPDEKLEDCRFIVENLKPVTALQHFMFARSLVVVACCTKDHDEGLLKITEDNFRLAVAADPSSLSSSLFQKTLGSVLAARGKCLEACGIFAVASRIEHPPQAQRYYRLSTLVVVVASRARELCASAKRVASRAQEHSSAALN